MIDSYLGNIWVKYRSPLIQHISCSCTKRRSARLAKLNGIKCVWFEKEGSVWFPANERKVRETYAVKIWISLAIFDWANDVNCFLFTSLYHFSGKWYNAQWVCNAKSILLFLFFSFPYLMLEMPYHQKHMKLTLPCLLQLFFNTSNETQKS